LLLYKYKLGIRMVSRFAGVAGATRRYDVSRSMSSFFRQRNYMVHCKRFFLTAVCTFIPVRLFDFLPLSRSQITNSIRHFSCPSSFLGKVGNFRMFFDIFCLPGSKFGTMIRPISGHVRKPYSPFMFSGFPCSLMCYVDTFILNSEFVRAFTRASCLSIVFKSLWMSKVFFITNRAYSREQRQCIFAFLSHSVVPF